MNDLRSGLGRALGAVAHGALRIRRDVVRAQIAASFPDRDESWVRATARACYRHFGREFAMLVGGAPAVRAALANLRAPPSATRDLERRKGKGVVLVTGHLGNWELAGAFVARHVPFTTVAQRQRGAVGRRIRALRRDLGIDVVYRDEGAGRVIRALRDGACVGLVADQRARSGLAVPFFGRAAPTHDGPARLALRLEVPLVFCAVVRAGDGYELLWEPLDSALLESGDLAAVTAGWVSALERAVRPRPSQYFWFHRRWGTPTPTARYEQAGVTGAAADVRSASRREAGET